VLYILIYTHHDGSAYHSPVDVYHDIINGCHKDVVLILTVVDT